MEYRKFGRSGLYVSALCLGTMNFGDVTSKEDSFSIMDKACDLGFNFFDTADVYGGPQRPDIPLGYGISEEIIGQWLTRSGKRNEIVLATKLYQPMIPGPNGRRLSAYHIRKACEDSLRRLKTDHIDLYQMHHFDRDTPFEENWQAMDVLVQQGKVLYVGSCNFPAWGIATAQGEAKARHSMGIVSEQSVYNLCNRSLELEIFPCARHHGIAIMTYSPLAGGALAGKLSQSGVKSRRLRQTLAPQLQERILRYEALCTEAGLAPATVALAWQLANTNVTTPIVGPRTLEQLTSYQAATELKLPPDFLAKLDEIFPGPGGEAPEAYAW